MLGREFCDIPLRKKPKKGKINQQKERKLGHPTEEVERQICCKINSELL